MARLDEEEKEKFAAGCRRPSRGRSEGFALRVGFFFSQIDRLGV